MSTIPLDASRRLATLSRQLRQQSVEREVATQTLRASEMSLREQQEALSRAKASYALWAKRLCVALAACDVAAAEHALHEQLTCAARLRGLALAPQAELVF